MKLLHKDIMQLKAVILILPVNIHDSINNTVYLFILIHHVR